MEKIAKLKKLIDNLASALCERDRLIFDEEYPHALGKPCSLKQIESLESILGKPLPPSYRIFMELHNGWSKFIGDAKLLAVEDHGSDWVKERLLALATLFADFGENPFEEGAIPVLLGNTAKEFLIVDPRTVRENGEMDFVSFDICHEEDRFKDFTSFLQENLDILYQMIEDEKQGILDEEEDTED